jgi:hypothetical protein
MDEYSSNLLAEPDKHMELEYLEFANMEDKQLVLDIEVGLKWYT